MSKSLTLPLVLIVAGSVWFLKATDILPATSTLIASALFVLGVAALIIDGINKQSIVAGPVLMYLGGAVYVRSEYFIPFSPLIALGMIFLGCLLLLARSDLIPDKKSKKNEATPS
ncbi:MAG: hypothetical protein Q4E16_05095 [Neisseria sp.]|nr:hypothetical protein [Neisseria sp.]